MIPNQSRKSVEFEGTINRHGNIAVPRAVLDDFGGKSGSKIQVRLTGRVVSSKLRERRVKEEEIERIAARQLESRDQVVKFLLSEGALSHNKGIRRRLTRFFLGTAR